MSSPEQLTHKQKQVLALLQAGKTNKDIANALGIQAGTVKQHLVTIFRKLGVNNRTMAAMQPNEQADSSMKVSADTPAGQRMDEMHDLRDISLALDADRLPDSSEIERRPCAILIMTLDTTADINALTSLQHHLDTLVSRYHGVIIGRKSHQREVIFGLDVIDRLNPVYALFTVLTLAQEWSIMNPTQEKALRAHLSFGMCLASMSVEGNWTEEVLMSVALGQARQDIQQVPAGQLTVTPLVRKLLLAQGLALSCQQDSHVFTNWQLDAVFPDTPAIGMEVPLQQIAKLFNNQYEQNPIALITGEEGMGKTRLLAEMFAQCHSNHPDSILYFRCLPECFDPWLMETATAGSLARLIKHLETQAMIGIRHKILLLDDVHLLPKQDRNALIYLIEDKGYSAVLASNYGLRLPTLRTIHPIKCHHLTDEQMQALADAYLVVKPLLLEPDTLAYILRLAQGVPLFLISMLEEARTGQLKMPLSVIIAVMARMDQLKLNRAMLRQLLTSKTKTETLVPPASESFKQALVDAIQKGILIKTDDAHIRFRHPMIRLVLKSSLPILPDSEKLFSV